MTFQRELLQATLDTNHARAARSRVIKRLRKRESLPGQPHTRLCCAVCG